VDADRSQIQEPILCHIVDDDTSVAEVVRELIESEDTRVETFEHGSAAIAAMEKEPADVVITDLMMPDVGGIDVLRHARGVHPDVIVIIITGYGSLETAIEAIREGAYDYIRKPFKLQEMEVCFRNAADKIRLIRANRRLLRQLGEAYEELMALKKQGEEQGEGDSEQEGRRDLLFAHMPILHLGKPALDTARHLDRLRSIADLRREGLLTEREFQLLKAQLFSGIDEHA